MYGSANRVSATRPQFISIDLTFHMQIHHSLRTPAMQADITEDDIPPVAAVSGIRSPLHDNAQRLQLALAAGHLGEWSWDTATDKVEFGEEACRIFGIPPDSNVTWSGLRDRLHEEDRERARLAVEEALIRRVDYSIEYRIRRADDGRDAWVAAQGRGVYADDGAILGMIGVVRDITARRETETALRDSEQFNRTIIQSSRDCIKILNREGQILWMNDYGLRAVSLSCLDQVLGKCWVDFWSEAYRDAARHAINAAAAGGTGSFLGSLTIDGRTSWWDVVLTPIVAAGGERGRVLAVSRDVTDRITAEQALQEESRVLEAIHHTGAMLASQLDLQSLLQSVTDAATRLSGAQFGAFFYNSVNEDGEAFLLYTLSGAPREAFERFGHPRATAMFGPTFRGEGIIRCDDVLTDPRYGQWAPHHGMPAGHLPVRSYLAIPVTSRSGETIGGLFFGHPEPGVFTARSERLLAGLAAQAAIAIDNAKLYEAAQWLAKEREELLESERHARGEALRMSELKDEFLATLSHELRTPLSAILGWAQVLRRGAISDADLRKGVDTIERNARVQVQLIDDLLDMSRIVSGKIGLNLQLLNPVTFVEAALETVRPSAEAKRLRLETELNAGAALVCGDAGRLQQVLWNLLSNAIKFTPAEGRICVTLQEHGGHITIAVTDTGIGIRPEFLPYVFDRFRQADSSTSRRFGGLGLGLSIVKHLVELHAGSVSVHSAGEGAGAAFAVELPVMDAEGAGRNAGPLFDARQLPVAHQFEILDLTDVKVLVVDDEADARDLFQRLLVECDAQVICASSPEEALLLAEREKPHVFVSDIGMPGMDGFELLRRIRALGPERGGRVPAIALTAFGRLEDRTKALRAGFLGHLTKPVDPSELVTMIANIVEQSRK
ncbi:MAG: two-component hybrid sensor and regulator [Paucimonas sp.]|nr:two-component hybrid sensor and regulator [Paucimonas sp.]